MKGNRLDPVLRALPCALRGASTEELAFNNLGQLVLPSDLYPSVATSLVSLAEPCVLFKAIDNILHQIHPRGLLLQALYSGIRESLRSYLALTSELEIKVTQTKLSISSLQVILQSPTIYLRLFLTILKQCLEPGANVLSVLYEYVQHGDPLIRRYAEELYNQCYEPFKRILSDWEDFGSLDLDVHNEFFVRATETGTDEPQEFEIVESRIPRPLSQSDAKLSLERGRAIHFIRFVCQDTSYDGVGKTFEEVNGHTYWLLVKKNALLQHFEGLKDFMLLSDGSFVDSLFRNDTSSFLMQPVSEVGSYMASEFFVSAIDDLYAGDETKEAVMRCVDAYILGLETPAVTVKKQWRVWEAFIGKYHLDSNALKVIVDKQSVLKYERCFASLWRIRLAIYSLAESSQRLKWLSRSQDVSELIEANALMNMNLLQVQQFLYYRVIDQGWVEFYKEITGKKRQTLAQLKEAHETYLNKIVEATAAPARARAIQGIARLVLGLQRMVEDVEAGATTDTSQLASLLEAFNGLYLSLNYE